MTSTSNIYSWIQRFYMCGGNNPLYQNLDTKNCSIKRIFYSSIQKYWLETKVQKPSLQRNPCIFEVFALGYILERIYKSICVCYWKYCIWLFFNFTACPKSFTLLIIYPCFKNPIHTWNFFLITALRKPLKRCHAKNISKPICGGQSCAALA